MKFSTIKKRTPLPDSFGFILVAGICILYFIYGKLGLQLTSINSTPAIWVPVGITLAFFLLFGYKIWPTIFFIAYLANITGSLSIFPSLLIAALNTAEGFLGAYLINRFANGKHVFEKLSDFYKFILFAALLSTMISATFAVFTLTWTNLVNWKDYGSLWTTWWLGDTLSVLIFTPVLLLWGISPKLRWDKLTEFLLLIALILFVGLVVSASSFYFAYLIIPVLIWVALRFNTKGTVTAIAFFSIAAIQNVLHDPGSFNDSTHNIIQNRSLFLIQTFITFISLMLIPLSITLTSRKNKSREDNRLAEIFNATDSAIINTKFDGTIISWNRGAEKIYGYTEREMIGKNISILIPKEEKDKFLKIIENMKEKGKKIDYLETVHIRKDAFYIDVSLQSHPIMDEQGKIIGVSMISNDITIKKRKELAEQQQKIIEEERLRSEFIANAAHEIRTPLAIIKGNVDLALGMGTKKLLDSDTALHAINEEVNNLSRILKDLLFFTTKNKKFEKEIHEKIILSDFIGKIVKRSKALSHKKNISIKLEPIPPGEIMGNKIYLDKAFINIIKNAIFYGKNGGLITVSGSKTDKYIKIIIADNGIGISEENLPHIFERFFRADKSRGNEEGRSGLGLVIVKEVMEEYGGTVEAASTLGVGSTFTLTFPLAFSVASPSI